MKGVEVGKGKSKATAIELDDSSTDEEGSPPRQSSAAAELKIEDKVTNNLSSLFGNRAQMEKERLERQKRRRREANLPEESDDDDAQQNQDRPTPKRAMINSVKESQPLNAKTTHQFASVSDAKVSKAPLYWRGAIKKSFNQFSPTVPGIPFADFLLPTTPFQANGLTHAVIATYCADLQWIGCLFPKAAIEKGPEITFIGLEDSNFKEGVYSPMHPDLPNWVRLVVPRKGLSEYATMHMKFILLFYKDRLRLMILSGNMMEYDWKVIENVSAAANRTDIWAVTNYSSQTAFVHDFPRLPPGETDMTSDYGQQMKKVLRSLSVPSSHPAIKMMNGYNLNSTCEARIVASIPSLKPVSGWTEIEKVGLGRLNKIVRDVIGSKAKGGYSLEAQGSSMGTYSTRWLQQFHIISSGVKIEDVLPLPSGVKANKAWAKAVSKKESEKWPPIKLLFPSDRWVKTQSIQGPDGAGTFFGKSKQAVEKGFIDILYQPVSVRGNFMMHHKAILAIQAGTEAEEDLEKVIGWAYMGSHNLTQAAWGNISQTKAGAEPQCVIGNWELGVLMPLRKKDLVESQVKKESERMASNIITWERPVEKYRQEDIPWDQYNQS